MTRWWQCWGNLITAEWFHAGNFFPTVADETTAKLFFHGLGTSHDLLVQPENPLYSGTHAQSCCRVGFPPATSRDAVMPMQPISKEHGKKDPCHVARKESETTSS